MTLDQLIERLQDIRYVHGGHIGVSVVDGDEEYEVTKERVRVCEAILGDGVLIDLTV